MKYTAADNLQAHWRIYIDGADVTKYCTEADDKFGYVYLYQLDQNNQLCFVNGTVALERVKGSVRIVGSGYDTRLLYISVTTKATAAESWDLVPA